LLGCCATASSKRRRSSASPDSTSFAGHVAADGELRLERWRRLPRSPPTRSWPRSSRRSHRRRRSWPAPVAQPGHHRRQLVPAARCWYFRGDYACTRKGGDMCYASAARTSTTASSAAAPASSSIRPTRRGAHCLDAKVRIIGRKARASSRSSSSTCSRRRMRRVRPCSSGEMVLGVLVPARRQGRRAATARSARADRGTSRCRTGARRDVEGGQDRRRHLVLSGVAPAPWRLPAVEKLLVGQKLDAKLIARAAAAAVAGAKPSSTTATSALVRG